MTLIDTDILIDAARGTQEAIDSLADLAFVSKNQRDYKFIVGLNLLAYP